MSMIFCGACGGGRDIDDVSTKQVQQQLDDDRLCPDLKACRSWIETLTTEQQLRDWQEMWLGRPGSRPRR